MQETLEALRRIPYVASVEVLDEANPSSGLDHSSIQNLLSKRKKVSLIGRKGCAIFFANKSTIILIQSESGVNLGAIDLLLNSIE